MKEPEVLKVEFWFFPKILRTGGDIGISSFFSVKFLLNVKLFSGFRALQRLFWNVLHEITIKARFLDWVCRIESACSCKSPKTCRITTENNGRGKKNSHTEQIPLMVNFPKACKLKDRMQSSLLPPKQLYRFNKIHLKLKSIYQIKSCLVKNILSCDEHLLWIFISKNFSLKFFFWWVKVWTSDF